VSNYFIQIYPKGLSSCRIQLAFEQFDPQDVLV
jgi:hypothetical protein